MKRNHDRAPAPRAAAISRSMRSMKWLATNRCAIATALRTAFGARTAVADDADPGDAEERRAAVFRIVDALRNAERAAGQERRPAP